MASCDTRRRTESGITNNSEMHVCRNVVIPRRKVSAASHGTSIVRTQREAFQRALPRLCRNNELVPRIPSQRKTGNVLRVKTLCSQPARELSPQGTARSKKMYHRVQRTRLRRPAMTRLNLPKPYSLPPDCVGSRERDSPEVTCVKGQRPKPTDKRGETSKLSREFCSLRLACICFPCSLRHAAQNRSILEPVKELRNLVLSHCYSFFFFSNEPVKVLAPEQ